MEELNINLVIFLRLLRTTILVLFVCCSVRKSGYARQVRKHVRWQVLNLVRNHNVVGIFNVTHVPKTDELDNFNLGLLRIQLYHDVLRSQISVHGTNAGHVHQHLGNCLN